MLAARSAVRALVAQPLPGALVVLTLALGVGANVAIFSAVRGVLLSPLPYPQPESVVQVWTEHRVSPQLYTLLEERLTSVASLGDARPTPGIYVAHGHDPAPRLYVVARTAGDPAALAPSVSAAVAELDPLVPITRLSPMSEIMGESQARTRLLTSLLGGFAALALVLGAIGIYGVVSYGVSQRTREIGVRMALGADRSSVRGEVLRGALRPVAIGLVAGLGLAVLAGRLLAAQLYEVKSHDPLTFVGVAVAMLLVGAVAALGPARRAARLDPIQALRAE